MSNEEFWFGEPRLAIAYREMHEIRNEIRNQELWLSGVYNYRAFSSVAEALAYGLGGGKGKKPNQYPDEPLPITEKERQAALERNKKRTLDWVRSGQPK